ncbi:PHOSPHOPANTOTHENOYLCYSTEINE DECARBOXYLASE SUBUNIT VHS3-LIKE ISOFORM X1 [Salix koriyanagi]|uniref:PHOSPHOPANTOTHENOYLCYSTEINE DECARBOXYLASE SUBUNIT VHS3-LIKE ISOFORM X1 n=1 Tax=Salix koriyanagi TaxID=2511006 RepID=A0A9Q0VAY7_9ROSI|nr:PHOSPHOPANTOTHENOYLCYSTEINE DECARBOXYLASE SUBUNIT VHS3-LIKE ISOFORM X1 [Salix koriyanagi]
MGSLPGGSSVLPEESGTGQGFPLIELHTKKKSDPDSQDDSDTEDDEGDDDDDGQDDQDEDDDEDEDEPGKDSEDGGDPEDEPEANGWEFGLNRERRLGGFRVSYLHHGKKDWYLCGHILATIVGGFMWNGAAVATVSTKD